MFQHRLPSGASCLIRSHAAKRLPALPTPIFRPFSSIARAQPPHITSFAAQRCGSILSQLRPTPRVFGSQRSLSNSTPPTTSLFAQTARSFATRSSPLHNVTPSSPTTSIPRHLYSRARRRGPQVQYRSRTSLNGAATKNRQAQKRQTPAISDGKAGRASTGAVGGAVEQGKNVLNHLPSVPRFHRPTKEELLSAATGFWSRMRIRFKWLTIRSLRPFNMDDLSAFFSWVLLGHVIWIVVGTTTFLSVLILAINTVFAQETLAGWVGNYLTKSSGVKVVFESAIVPKWGGGVITFNNVFVSRRPGQQKSDVRKGSQTAAAAAAAELASERAVTDNEDTNYTQYDLSIETVNVTLSFAKWFNGHGLLRDVEVKGIRGVLDRTAVHYSDEYVDPRTFKHEHNTGDFEIESFKIEDLLISVYQPNNFRPFSVSIFSADLPRLRKQWLFYDFLSANNVSGSFDDSLFTVHPRQTHNLTETQVLDRDHSEGEHWQKRSRIRVDGLKIDHLNRGVEGPFSWINEGEVDIIADIALPADASDGIAKVVSDFYDRVEAQVLQKNGPSSAKGQQPPSRTNVQLADSLEAGVIYNHPSSPSTDILNSTSLTSSGHNNSSHNTSKPTTNTTPQPPTSATQTPVILDLHITLTSVHASVPLFSPHMSYINSALILPIVAYINTHSSASTPMSQKPHIPITCRVVKPLRDFEGSWTVFDSGLMEDLSRETYEAFVRGVNEKETRGRRMRKVGFWGLQVVVQALVLGLAGQVA